MTSAASTFRRRRRARLSRRQPCYMLLDVALSIGLLGMAMAVIGAQVSSSWESSHDLERFARVRMLAESKFAELDIGLVEINDVDQRIEGDFGRLFPDYAWRFYLQPTSTPELFLVRLDVLYLRRPDLDEAFDFDAAEVARSFYTLRATPVVIDMQRDFGLDDEQTDLLAESVALEGFDPRALDPGMFRELELEDLIAIMPALLEAFGMTTDDIAAMLPPELLAALEEAQAEDQAAEEEGDVAPEDGDEAQGSRDGQSINTQLRPPQGSRPRGGRPQGGGRRPTTSSGTGTGRATSDRDRNDAGPSR